MTAREHSRRHLVAQGIPVIARSLRDLALHRLTRTLGAAVVLGYVYRFIYFHVDPDVAEVTDDGILWYLVAALTAALFGMAISVVDWQAKNCGLASLLFGLHLQFSYALAMEYGVTWPYPVWTMGIVRASIVIGSTLLIGSVVKYVWDGSRLPPPYNSLRFRRAVRRANIRAMQDSITIANADELD